MSKREELREKRRKHQKRNQYVWLGVFALFVLGFVGLVIVPPLLPVTNVVDITPRPRPNAQGLSMGDPNAPVKVEEFSDFQCPGCLFFHINGEPTLIQQYIETGQVHFTYVPLAFLGVESTMAATAAYCAADQDRFWDYLDILFANQTGENVGDYSERRLVAFADHLDLDLNAFRSCYREKKFEEDLMANTSRGDQVGVTQTPSFLVNGELVEAARLFQAIDAIPAGND
jgi:protein-disulfide isomerase